MKMKVDLQKIGPVGIVIILLISAIAFAMFFTVDLGVPAPYQSLHDTEYYRQSYETMQALHEELTAHVLPNLEGVVDSAVGPDRRITVAIRARYYDRVTGVLLRDFDASLFSFTKITDE